MRKAYERINNNPTFATDIPTTVATKQDKLTTASNSEQALYISNSGTSYRIWLPAGPLLQSLYFEVSTGSNWSEIMHIGGGDLTIKGTLIYATIINILTTLSSKADTTYVSSTFSPISNPTFTGTAIVNQLYNTNSHTNHNTNIGYLALANVSTGGSNSACGWNALTSNTTGNANTAVGNKALMTNIGGASNVAIGSQSFSHCNLIQPVIEMLRLVVELYGSIH